MPEPAARTEPQRAPTHNIRFLESMSRPLIVAFLVFAVAGIGLVVLLFAHPPESKQVALLKRRSPPVGAFSHDALLERMVAVPATLPPVPIPHDCPFLRGLVVEGGAPAVDRIERVLDPLCQADIASKSPEFHEAMRALATARIRFALF